MQSLAIKYRPKNFDDVQEQGSIKLILKEQVDTKSFKHGYLFTGGAGTGKTTCARILAKDINEQKGTPLEIDAASNNGVEHVREIIDGAKFKPIDCNYKTFIIDECHMLSTGAWNALLKTLEEPPAHVIIILCTTDPQKIPATILSRVQRYDFQRISFKTVVKRLNYIVDCENKELDKKSKIKKTDESLEYIAKLADGGMRDAITLLDKCLSFSNDLSIENVTSAIGTVNYNVMLKLTKELIDVNATEAIKTIENVYRAGIDLKQFSKQYVNFLLDICKYQLLGDFDYLQIPSTLSEELENFNSLDFEICYLLLKEISELNSKLRWETAAKVLIECTFILLCEQIKSIREEQLP